MSTPALKLDDLTKSAAINLRSTLAWHADGTARVSGFDAADGCDVVAASWVGPTGARL